MPLYSHTRTADWSWGTTDQYLYNNSAASGNQYCYIYIDVKDNTLTTIAARANCNHVGTNTTRLTITLQECAQGGSWTDIDSDYDEWSGTENTDQVITITGISCSPGSDRHYRLKIHKWNDGIVTTADLKLYGIFVTQ